MQDNSGQPAQTIDGVATGVAGLLQRLKSGEKLTSRGLRGIWGGRLRPFWRLHIDIYRALSRRFLELGENYLAIEVADEGGQFFGDDVALILTRALATARSGAPQGAQEFLARKESVLAGAEEAKSLLARTFKDLWKSSGEERYLQEAFDLYHLDYTTTKGDRTFPGVNAASMARFLGRAGDAERIASDILGILRERPDTSSYWDQVTIAECQLVAGAIEPARTSYAGAAGSGQVAHAHLATTRAQARLLLRHLGRDESEFDPCFPLPGVIAFTGHRIDGPGRPVPRFPGALAPEIKERIREVVLRSKAGFGYAAAASGADILFLECLQEAGLETFIHLPMPEDDFIRASVADAPGWLERYRAVTAGATEFTCAPHAGGGALAFDYGNRLLLGAAAQRARQLGSELRLLAVWDGLPGSPGGTGDYVALARGIGCPVEVISLPAHPSGPAAAQTSDEGDKLLSILSLSLDLDEKAEQQLADLLDRHEAIHREAAGARVRLFFPSPSAAAAAARAILRDLGPHLSSAPGLHTGPVRMSTHPLTRANVIRGTHAQLPDDLAALEPAGLIYASSAFAALLGLDADSGSRCEFLGYRPLRPGGPGEPVFQVLA